METLNFAERQETANSLKMLLASNQTDFIELANIIAHGQTTNVIDLTPEVKFGKFDRQEFGKNILNKFYVFIKYFKKNGSVAERFGYMNNEYNFAGGTNKAQGYGYITYFDLDAGNWRNCHPDRILKFIVIEHIENSELLQ